MDDFPFLSLYLFFSVFSKFSTVDIYCFSNTLKYFNQMRYKLTFPKGKVPHSFWRRCVLNKILNGDSVVTWQRGEEQCSESNDR